MEQILDMITGKNNREKRNTAYEILDLKMIVLAALGGLVKETDQAELSYEEGILLGFKKRLSELSSTPKSLHRCLQEYLSVPNCRDEKIFRLAKHYELSTEELLTLSLCIAVEEDPVVAPCLAWLQNNTRSTRPSFGLLQQLLSLFSEEGVQPLIPAILAGGNAVKCEILAQNNTAEPLPNQSVSVPIPLVLAMRNSIANFDSASHLDGIDDYCLTDSNENAAASHARSLLSEERALLKVRCAFPVEGKQVAVCIARHIGKTALHLVTNSDLPPGIGAYCFLANCIPVFEFNLGPNEKQQLPIIKGYTGPCLCLLGNDGDIESTSDSVLEWHLQVPEVDERTQIWKNFISDELAEKLGPRFIQGAGRIAQLSRVALREAKRFDREPNINDIHKAAWNTDNGGLDSLAQPIYEQIGDKGLVLSHTIRRQMKSLYLRCLARESLDENLGVSIRQRYHSGVKAMMVGPSGTGKTLSAAWLATRLGLPLYRVDIASIVSKYIGETEKNLSNLMEKAENSDVILLFDEADALFGKRTDVKDSSDRFANSQTNYLLQRIENYRGIVLLTSNSRSRIDQSFLRRIDYIIEFSNPNPEERRLLWRVHLGDQHDISSKDVNKISVKCELGGGHIRNAVLTAAVHAKEAERAIQYQDLLEGIACEYRKVGKQPPLALS